MLAALARRTSRNNSALLLSVLSQNPWQHLSFAAKSAMPQSDSDDEQNETDGVATRKPLRNISPNFKTWESDACEETTVYDPFGGLVVEKAKKEGLPSRRILIRQFSTSPVTPSSRGVPRSAMRDIMERKKANAVSTAPASTMFTNQQQGVAETKEWQEMIKTAMESLYRFNPADGYSPEAQEAAENALRLVREINDLSGSERDALRNRGIDVCNRIISNVPDYASDARGMIEFLNQPSRQQMTISS